MRPLKMFIGFLSKTITLMCLCATVGWAANANVQCVKGDYSSGTTITASITATSGNLLVVGANLIAGNNSDVVMSVADGTNGSYTKTDQLAGTAGGVNWDLSVWYFKNATGGALTVTVTFGVAATAGSAIVCEVSGAHTTAPLDQNTIQEQVTPGTGANAVSSGSVTTTENGEYVFSCSLARSGAETWTVGSGYTTSGVSPSASQVSPCEYQIQGAAGSVAGTWTASAGASNTYITAVATFKAAAVSATAGHFMLMGAGR